MNVLDWWRARRARARRINDQLAAWDGRSRLDDMDRHWTPQMLDRLDRDLREPGEWEGS